MPNENPQTNKMLDLAIKGRNQVPLDERGYNQTPLGKIEKPKPSPTPPPKKP